MTPDGWRQVRLSDVADHRRRKVVPTRGDLQPYVALEHLAQGGPRLLGWSTAESAVSAKTAFRAGDLLFGKLRPNLRKAARAPFNGLCSTDILALFGKEGIDSRYLSQMGQWRPLQRHAVATSSGTKMPRTSWANLRELEFSLPPISEQRKIAAILSSVDDAIEKAQAVIDQIGVVKRGLMQELLTRGLPGRHTRFKPTGVGDVPARWRLMALDKVVEAIEAGWSPKCEARQAKPGEWGVLKVSSISSGLFCQHENKALLDQLEPRPQLEVKDGDVLVARASGVLNLVGRSAFVHRTRRYLMLSDKTLRLRVNKSVMRPMFLHLLLEDVRIRRQILIRTTGSHMRNISQRALRSIPIPIPRLEEQERIEVLERHASTRLEEEARSLRQLGEVKSALMSVLLTGELRVTPDPDPE